MERSVASIGTAKLAPPGILNVVRDRTEISSDRDDRKRIKYKSACVRQTNGVVEGHATLSNSL